MDNDQKFERYYNLSLRYLSYRPRSEKEILDYLKKKKLDEEIIAQIIAKLIEYKFIDDTAFTKFWIEQRSEYKHKPIRVIRFELLQKGIEKELIEESLPKESGELDLENAKRLKEKKMDFYRNLDPKKRQEKVMNYLLRKGFSYEIVKKALNS
ncbi:MAG: RecX family transcriptional regulator [Patescibacteria group bacterium]